ncbi:MAG: hypothetical protein ACOX1G_07830 [bacterium]|jgi:hypothetical protein
MRLFRDRYFGEMAEEPAGELTRLSASLTGEMRVENIPLHPDSFNPRPMRGATPNKDDWRDSL